MGVIPARPEICGDFAHDAPDTTVSFPVKVGGLAKNFDGTTPNYVAEDDRAEFRTCLGGRQLVEIGHPFYFQTYTAWAGATTNAQLVAAPAAGLSLYVTDIWVTADTVGSFIFLDDLTSTGAKIKIRCPANDTRGLQLRQPIKLTAAKALGVTTDFTTSSIFISGYTAP